MKENKKLAKWLNDEMKPSELTDFIKTEDYLLYEKIKSYSSRLEVGYFDKDKMLKNILKQGKSNPKSIFLSRKLFIRTAAVLVIGLGITFVLQTYSSVTQLAPSDKKTIFSLPDNSVVVLNSDSEIQYKKWNWNNKRILKLKGEAYFRVAKGKKFEVVTNIGKVAVLGTQFNVQAEEDRFEVTCFEGRVKVNYNKTELVLTPGKSVTFENGKQTNTIDTSEKPAWLEDQIAFEQANLNEIIAEIQKQYNVSILLKIEKTDALFSGKIPTKNLDMALRIIATTYNLKFTKTTNKIIFQEK